MKKKQYIQVSLITGRTYLGYVEDNFVPNLEEEISFTLSNVHFLFPQPGKNGDSNLVLLGIEDGPEGLIPQMDIMWHAVASIQYLKEDSSLIKRMEEKEKILQKDKPRKKADLVVLKKENI